jgi:ABC-type nitrate/sulfonate/bicarbonate transport system substrate-binding protein
MTSRSLGRPWYRWIWHRWMWLLLLPILVGGVDLSLADPVTIQLGIGGASAENLQLLLARPDLTPHQNKDYKIDYTRFEGTDKRFQAFEAGALDIALMNANGALFAAGEGLPFKMIASVARESPRGANVNFMVLDGSPIHSVQDLKGKTFGVVSLSSNTELQIRVMLEKNGMHESDIKLVPIPFPAMYEALKSGLIDVGSFPQPFLAMAKHNGGVRTIFTAKDAAPYEEELLILIAHEEFLNGNRPATQAFLADLVAATEFYNAHTHEARKALLDANMVKIDPDVFYEMQDPYHEPSCRLDVEALARMQELQVSAGFQKSRANLSEYVDLSYLPK